MTYIDVISYLKGYHFYKNVWTPPLQEQVHGEIKPNNPVDNYVVAVQKDGDIGGHLPLRKNEKTIFFISFELILWKVPYNWLARQKI